MLLIFDLDDTLIDTSGCLTPLKLEKALGSMVDAGLNLSDFNSALEQLKRLNQEALSARDALIEFLEINESDSEQMSTFLEIGSREVYENFSSDLPVFAFDDVPEILSELAAAHHLALVTIGYPQQQRDKLKKAGIDSALFSKIEVCSGSKKPYYEQIAREFGFVPSDVVVCGDKISVDLIPAKELGFKTIHMKKGRGAFLHSRTADEIDASIEAFAQIREVIPRFMSEIKK